MGSARPALVGRSAELEQLRTAARRAAAGRGRAVVIEGGIGLGKTALLGELAAECAALGMRTLHGTAEEVEQRLPFAALSACARPLQGTDEDLARVTAMLRGEHALAYSMNAAHHELAVTEALLELADRWLSRGPVALLLDDAQWADPSSIVVLHRLARGIEQVPLLLATAARALAQGDALEGLERSLLAGGALRLRLEPLPEAATVALAERQLGAPPGPLLRRLLRRSTGNPMYLETVLTAYLRDGLITVAGGHAELSGGAAADPDAVPEPLVDLTRRQAELVPRAYREVLQTAAVFGSTVDVGQLAQVLDRPVMEISEVLVDALDSGMLADHGGTLRFRQGVVRELLARSVPRAVQTALHQRAGRALSGGPGLSERTGAHLLAGGELGPDGVQWLTAHADALTGRAPDLAVKLLRRAVAETGRGRAGRCTRTWCGRCCGTANRRRPRRPPAPRWAGAPGRTPNRTCAGCWCRPATARAACRRRSPRRSGRWPRRAPHRARRPGSGASPRCACTCWAGPRRRRLPRTGPSPRARPPVTGRRSPSAAWPERSA
ncbi:AAA family ATPase [Catellatospora bangladeshensis]|uniref:AAA family ATPase n=1 Tax=Catellatospora bangladeshensis TaxID=310355 RepID=UPI0036160D66